MPTLSGINKMCVNKMTNIYNSDLETYRFLIIKSPLVLISIKNTFERRDEYWRKVLKKLSRLYKPFHLYRFINLTTYTNSIFGVLLYVLHFQDLVG